LLFIHISKGYFYYLEGKFGPKYENCLIIIIILTNSSEPTSQHHGILYYGSQAWLGEHTPNSQKKILHFIIKLVTVDKNEWKQRKSLKGPLKKLEEQSPR